MSDGRAWALGQSLGPGVFRPLVIFPAPQKACKVCACGVGGAKDQLWQEQMSRKGGRDRRREALRGSRWRHLSAPLIPPGYSTPQPLWASTRLSLKPLCSSCLLPTATPAPPTFRNCPALSLPSLAIGLGSLNGSLFLAHLQILSCPGCLDTRRPLLLPTLCGRKSSCLAVTRSGLHAHLCHSPVVNLQTSGFSYLSLSFLLCNSEPTRLLHRVFWGLNMKALCQLTWHLPAVT